MAGKRISKTAINWAEFAKNVSEDSIHHFRTLKFRNDTYIRRIADKPDSLPKIDWDFYKNKISTPGIVDTFKQKYESLTLPYPSDQGLISKIDAEQKETEIDFGEFEKNAREEIVEKKKILAALESQLKYSEMSYEEYYLAKPEEAIYPLGVASFSPHTKEQKEYTKDLMKIGEWKQ